jgi:alanine racemase
MPLSAGDGAKNMLSELVTWAEIDLDAISHNVQVIQQLVGPQVEIIAIVKSNAYGHGAIPVSRAILQAGAARLAVHRLIEGQELRMAGIEAPILVMGYTPEAGAAGFVRWDLTPCVTTREFARALSDCAVAHGKRIKVHMKVDTGMNRHGLPPVEAPAFAQELQGMPGIELEGVFTHFATADEPGVDFVHAQLASFEAALAGMRAVGACPNVIHAANAAAAMRFPETHFTAVRPGIALYGLSPSSSCVLNGAQLRRALTLKTRVCRIHKLLPGDGVSYGLTYVATHPVTVALVSIGYGDGYHRSLSNLASVLIRGRRAPILGTICMDQFVVDVSHIAGVQPNDEVVVLGAQENEEVTAEELAQLGSTIRYEMLTSLEPRVVRVYKRDGRIVEVTSIGDFALPDALSES